MFANDDYSGNERRERTYMLFNFCTHTKRSLAACNALYFISFSLSLILSVLSILSLRHDSSSYGSQTYVIRIMILIYVFAKTVEITVRCPSFRINTIAKATAAVAASSKKKKDDDLYIYYDMHMILLKCGWEQKIMNFENFHFAWNHTYIKYYMIFMIFILLDVFVSQNDIARYFPHAHRLFFHISDLVFAHRMMQFNSLNQPM